MRPTPFVPFALAMLALAGTASAEPRLRGIPAHVRAGQPLRIAWTGLGPDAHEAELELSLAGGRWVRISPELEARECGFTWHVPDGLAGPARLRLRYGGEWFEAQGEVSTPFLIVADTGATTMPIGMSPLGEWWCLGAHAGAIPAHELAGRAALSPGTGGIALAPETQRVGRPVGAAALASCASFVEPVTIAPPSARGTAARQYPLRI